MKVNKYWENRSKSGLWEEEEVEEERWSEWEGGEGGREAKSSHHYYQDSHEAPSVMEGEEMERDKEKMELKRKWKAGLLVWQHRLMSGERGRKRERGEGGKGKSVQQDEDLLIHSRPDPCGPTICPAVPFRCSHQHLYHLMGKWVTGLLRIRTHPILLFLITQDLRTSLAVEYHHQKGLITAPKGGENFCSEDAEAQTGPVLIKLWDLTSHGWAAGERTGDRGGGEGKKGGDGGEASPPLLLLLLLKCSPLERHFITLPPLPPLCHIRSSSHPPRPRDPDEN